MTNDKPVVVWFQAITCNGNTHSLLSANASRLEQFLNSFNLIYHPSLTIDNSLDKILNSVDKIDFQLLKEAIRTRAVEFENIECSYLMEEVYGNI